MNRTISILIVFGLLSIILSCQQQDSVSPLMQETETGLKKTTTSNAEETNFHFVSLSTADIVDGVHHTFLMSGDGVIDSRKHSVEGGGTFQHTDTDPAKPLPKPILGEGIWEAKRLVSFDTIGTYGVGVSGVLNMEIILIPNNGEPVLPATLEVVCNIPPANLFTGSPEGYVLSTGAPFGDFTPVVPPVGITWFTDTDDDDDDGDDAPDIAAAPIKVDFRQVDVGSSTDKTFVLKNDGTTDLEINKKQVAGSSAEQYEVLDLDVPAVLTPGESREVTVRFSPASSGIKKGHVKLFSNDPDENPFSVSFKGTGIDDL